MPHFVSDFGGMLCCINFLVLVTMGCVICGPHTLPHFGLDMDMDMTMNVTLVA